MTLSANRLDFLVIGAPKCGTTSLWHHLKSHPEVSVPPDKEREFFNRSDLYRRGLDWFVRTTFPDAAPDAALGTVTPRYMSDSIDPIEVTAARLGSDVPDARLIALLRDPIERAISEYRGWRRDEVARKSLDELVSRLRPKRPTKVGLLAKGEYGRILSVFREHFPAEQLCVAFTADLEKRPQSLLQRLFEFIGVDPDHVPENLDTRHLRGGLTNRASDAAIKELTDYMDESVWPLTDNPRGEARRGFNWWLKHVWRVEPDDSGREISAEARAKLEAHYARDGERLEELIGAEVPWLRAYGGSASG